MLPLLAANWSPLLFRGSIAELFGILALLWPGLTPDALTSLFGTYALVDGTLALLVAFRARGVPGFGSLLFEGLVRIGAGVVVFAYLGITQVELLTLFAVWVILSGIAEITVAMALRRELSGEWPLPVAGTLSVAFGVLLLLLPSEGVLALMMGFYALIFGITLMALALRLRQLTQEIASA
jgi:uncharacterized membrane protein HdeD (DUF308 family)